MADSQEDISRRMPDNSRHTFPPLFILSSWKPLILISWETI